LLPSRRARFACAWWTRRKAICVKTNPNIPTTFGAESGGGTEDPIYVMRASDLILWESGIRARVLPETKAANLTILLQIYGYLAFTAAPYPQSVVEITGLTAPTF
jgi:hypothetical protein